MAAVVQCSAMQCCSFVFDSFSSICSANSAAIVHKLWPNHQSREGYNLPLYLPLPVCPPHCCSEMLGCIGNGNGKGKEKLSSS